jgi:tetratricopeptide (TPR) repeat protein
LRARGRGRLYFYERRPRRDGHAQAEIRPSNEARRNRANFWTVSDQPERAIADFDAAIKLDPGYATAFYNRANAKLNAGDKPGAIADYREAVALRPGFKEAADMLKELGMK